jgi:hypothetical protein
MNQQTDKQPNRLTTIKTHGETERHTKSQSLQTERHTKIQSLQTES